MSRDQLSFINVRKSTAWIRIASLDSDCGETDWLIRKKIHKHIAKTKWNRFRGRQGNTQSCCISIIASGFTSGRYLAGLLQIFRKCFTKLPYPIWSYCLELTERTGTQWLLAQYMGVSWSIWEKKIPIVTIFIRLKMKQGTTESKMGVHTFL